MKLFATGISHHQAPVELREQLAFSEEEIAEVVRELRRDKLVREAAILSTCNRTEFYGISHTPEIHIGYIRTVLDRIKGTELLSRLPDLGLSEVEDAAARHLFRVSAGLDSMVLGESQILQQIKEAYSAAVRSGGTGVILNKLFHQAIRVGKRARTDTRIGEGSVSMALVAVELAQKVFGRFTGRKALVIGAGETGTLAAKYLHDGQIEELYITNRTLVRAEELAAAVDGHVIPWEEYPRRLGEMDIVVSAIGTHEYMVTKAMTEPLLRGRGNRPWVFLDLGLPRDVDPEINRLANCFVQDVDAAQSVISRNLDRRRQEVPRVEEIISGEVEAFEAWKRSLSAVPTIAALRRQFEVTGRELAEKYYRQLGLKDPDQLRQFSSSLISKLLHEPTTRLRELDDETATGLSRLEAIRELFDLEETDDDPHRDEE